MKFRTEIPVTNAHHSIDYDDNIILIGSCFTENIGDKLNYLKFNTMINPYGILFNPVALEKSLTEAINLKKYTKEDLYFFDDYWLSLNHHTRFSSENTEEVLSNINTNVEKFHEFLKTATHIIITLGTAWVYRFLDQDKIVANCHKIPQKKFTKELLTVEEVEESLQGIIALLKNYNKDITIIFTISPVRHLKDGFVENQRSKSHLISAVHRVVDPRKNLYYFPSYEIMMDDLRDYRFYDQDMVHPNSIAIEYIWEKFVATWLTENTQSIMKEVESILRDLHHKAFKASSDKHKKFLKNLQEKIAIFKEKYPKISF